MGAALLAPSLYGCLWPWCKWAACPRSSACMREGIIRNAHHPREAPFILMLPGCWQHTKKDLPGRALEPMQIRACCNKWDSHCLGQPHGVETLHAL